MQPQTEVPASAPSVPASAPSERAARPAGAQAAGTPVNAPTAQPQPLTLRRTTSGLRFEVSSRLRAWAGYRPVRLGLVLVVALTVIWLLTGRLSNGLPDQMVVNYGYQYHFKFYTHAVPTTLEGEAALATKQGVIALGSPTKSPLVTDCSDMGSSWSQAFVATMAGANRPVCSQADGDTYTYNAYFSDDGVTHIFAVTYSISVAQAAKRTPDIAKLQAIFNSVQVTPQPQN